MSRALPRPPPTAGVVMRFAPFARAVSALLLATAVIALLAVSAWRRGTDVDVLRAFLVLAVLLLTVGAAEVLGVAHRLVPGGVERVAPPRRRVLVRWSDVDSLAWVGGTGGFEVRARGGEVVRVYRQLTGMPSFARAALEGVPARVLDARPGLRERLEQLASGVEPPDDGERPEWLVP